MRGRISVMHGTAISVYHGGDHIFMATDGAVLSHENQRYTPIFTLNKITEIGERELYASAGILADPGGGFDVREIAKAAVREARNLRGAVEMFRDRVRAPLTRVMELIRRDSREMFRREYGDKHALSSLFIGLPHGGTAAEGYIMTFQVDGMAERGPIKFLEYFQEMDKGHIVCLGSNTFANQLLDHSSLALAIMPLPQMLALLVEEEIRNNPTHVGPPIHIAGVTQGGIVWVQR